MSFLDQLSKLFDKGKELYDRYKPLYDDYKNSKKKKKKKKEAPIDPVLVHPEPVELPPMPNPPQVQDPTDAISPENFGVPTEQTPAWWDEPVNMTITKVENDNHLFWTNPGSENRVVISDGKGDARSTNFAGQGDSKPYNKGNHFTDLRTVYICVFRVHREGGAKLPGGGRSQIYEHKRTAATMLRFWIVRKLSDEWLYPQNCGAGI